MLQRFLSLFLGLAAVLAVSTVFGAVVINEIMYNTPGTPDVEYIELFNNSPIDVDLSGWYLLDGDDAHTQCVLTGILGAGEFLVVAGDAGLFTATWPAVANTNAMTFDGDCSWALGNTSESVRLYNSGGTLQDIVGYFDSLPWPTAADGSGPSLELINPDQDNNVAASWAASLVTGTPGEANSSIVWELPSLRINELLADNSSGLQDEFGQAEDWVEITNTGDEPVSLDGLFLSDNLANSTQWPLPDTVLPAGGYVVIWADSEPAQGPLHANFSFSSAGDEIGIFDSLAHGNALVDGLVFGLQNPDVAWGYPSAAANAPEYLSSPTPGGANSVDLYSPICINEFMTTSAAGGVDDWLEIHNRGTEPFPLGGCFISDNISQPEKYAIAGGTILPPGGYLVLSEIDLGFSFSSSGDEVIMLTGSDGVTGLDYLDYGLQVADVSRARQIDGGQPWYFCDDPTPGVANAPSAVPEILDRDAGSRLLPCVPNPFNPRTILRFELAGRGPVRLDLFDTRGRHLQCLRSEVLEAGFHETVWDGRDQSGRALPSGVYFARLRTALGTTTNRLALVR